MALIVEDGSGVPDANSYRDETDLLAYAAARGVTLTDVEVKAIKAMDYIESFREQFQGAKTDPLQSLQWPRAGVAIDCVAIADDFMPVELGDAQAQLMMALEDGIELVPNVEGGQFAIREKVGPLEVAYSDSVNVSQQPKFRVVDQLLAPLFTACGTGAAFTVLRV